MAEDCAHIESKDWKDVWVNAWSKSCDFNHFLAVMLFSGRYKTAQIHLADPSGHNQNSMALQNGEKSTVYCFTSVNSFVL